MFRFFKTKEFSKYFSSFLAYIYKCLKLDEGIFNNLSFFKRLDMIWVFSEQFFWRFYVEIFFCGSAYFCGSASRKSKCFGSQALVLSRNVLYDR